MTLAAHLLATFGGVFQMVGVSFVLLELFLQERAMKLDAWFLDLAARLLDLAARLLDLAARPFRWIFRRPARTSVGASLRLRWRIRDARGHFVLGINPKQPIQDQVNALQKRALQFERRFSDLESASSQNRDQLRQEFDSLLERLGQIEEQTLGRVPRILQGLGAALILFGTGLVIGSAWA